MPGLWASSTNGWWSEVWKTMRFTPRAKEPVPDRLEVRGRLAPARDQGHRREGLGGDQGLAVDVRRRRRLAHVGGVLRVVLLPGERRPELAHRNVHLALAQQPVPGGRQAGAHGLRVEADALLAQVLGGRRVVVLRQEVRDGAAEVPQEAVAHVRALHHATGQHRQVRRRVVAAPRAELLDHVVGPVLVPGLPAVHQEVAEALAEVRTHGAGDHVDVVLDVGVHVLAAELVDLVAGRLRRGGMVLLAGERVAHAQDDPLAGGHVPVERVRPCPSSTVRSTTLARAMAWSAHTAGVPAPLGSMKVAKLALSSHWCTRGPSESSISARSNCRTGGMPNRAAIGFGGGGGKHEPVEPRRGLGQGVGPDGEAAEQRLRPRQVERG